MDYTEEYLKNKRNKKLKSIFIGIGILLIALIGSTYAFFTYSKSLSAFTLTSGGITAEFTSGSNEINITNGYPISDEFALAHLDELDYIDFTISGNITNPDQGLTYEIYLTEKSGNTLDSDYIKVYITNSNGERIKDPKIYNNLDYTTYSPDSSTGKVIYKLEGLPGNYNKSFRIYAWIDKDYEQNEVSQEFTFYVNLYAYNGENKLLSNVILKKLTTTNDVPDNYILDDGIYYISGCKEDGDSEVCNEKNIIDFNYVWYSGKLWRITAIYSDGRIKMITEEPITAIYWGSDGTYEGSWIYQWFNEDFKDTLYDYQNIIDTTATWNATMMTSSGSKPPETTIIMAPVGSLNSYEYVQSYLKLGAVANSNAYGNGYLNNDYSWWLITPCSNSSASFVGTTGRISNQSPSSNAVPIRSSIILKFEILLSGGTGTVDNPYKISSDKEEATASTTLINTRVSGEYVTFKDELYRIVGIENNTTKIVKADCIRNGSNVSVSKKFASSVTFGKSTNTKTDTYWDYYLNNTWLKEKFEIDPLDEYPENTYNMILAKGTYFLGEYGTGVSYKNTICKEANTTDSIKNCVKIDDSAKIYIGYVGLLRVGEMFSSSTAGHFLITPYNSTSVRHNYGNGRSLWYTQYGSDVFSASPSLNLKSEVVILGGDGTLEHPFEIE